MESTKLLTELNGHVVRAQRALAEYLPPNSEKSEREVIGELLQILDNRSVVQLQDEIAASVAERPVFFANG
jgi:regulator of sirC expression with transglutaminase-like and TPR domain